MKKFLNALGVIFLFILIFGIIGKSLDFDELDKNDDPNSDDPIVNPGDIIGPGTNNPSVESRIAVPNTGYINKIYVDTSLSVEDVKEILSLDNLSYIGEGNETDTDNMYYVLSSNDQSVILMINNTDDEGLVICYQIGENFNVIFDELNASGIGLGWNPEFNGVVNFNVEVISELEGLTFGLENDKLIDLFYTYPSELVKEEVTTLGTPVPTSGMVENIYVNTSLSVDEVVAICETLTFVPYQDGVELWACFIDSTMKSDVIAIYKSVEESNTRYSISVYKGGSDYAFRLGGDIFLFDVVETTGVIKTVGDTDGDGWLDTFNGVVEFNMENQLSVVASQLNFTTENEKAANLFSITPFN